MSFPIQNRRWVFLSSQNGLILCPWRNSTSRSRMIVPPGFRSRQRARDCVVVDPPSYRPFDKSLQVFNKSTLAIYTECGILCVDGCPTPSDRKTKRNGNEKRENETHCNGVEERRPGSMECEYRLTRSWIHVGLSIDSRIQFAECRNCRRQKIRSKTEFAIRR